MKTDILGVKVDKINMSEAVAQVVEWVTKPGKHYIVTPNVEFIMLAQKDKEFQKILNSADLSIPDSSHFGWAVDQLRKQNKLLKILKIPLFLFPQLTHFDVVTGTDLMEELIKIAAEKGFTVGLLGGQDKVALKLKERLKVEYPKLKVSYADSDIEVDRDGNVNEGVSSMKYQVLREKTETKSLNTKYIIPNTDLLFVAFGQVKQEKWIYKNLKNQPVKVMMGVGGAFDYLAGEVQRAPKGLRSLGFEWLFRLIIQPWRIKRFWALIRFVYLIVG